MVHLLAMVCLHSAGSDKTKSGGPTSSDLVAMKWQQIKCNGVTAYKIEVYMHKTLYMNAKHKLGS